MSRRVKKKRPSEKEESSNVDDSINTGFYDHLRPKASGTTEVSVPRRGPNSLLAVSLIVIIFVGLALFGAFTNNINFGGNNNGPSSIDNINNDIDRNVYDIADVCSTPDQHDNGDGTLFSYGFNLYMISLAGGQYEIPSGVGYILDEDGEECYMGMHIDGGENFVHVLFGINYNGPLPTIHDFFGI
ncbi:MAG: hypothetical protein IH840_13920 [Candidatus Heimdallarchaeota archaeon]|nr:hypothetical protein [Candidatus Heimdallarchaeota archaeon]